MTAIFDLPVADKPGWELKNDSEELKSISDSCVILQSLRQSRERWLSSMFPKFSTKSRNDKASEPSAPPHTVQSRGRCDLQIGPHIFPSTTFYEVHYLSQANAVVPQPSSQSAAGSSAGDAMLNPVTMITPALIAQVNNAASSNPTLAHLLQLAAAGKATPEQLKTLGVLIQSLASTATSVSVVQPKDFDLIIEFADNNSERWIFPRGPVVCNKISDTCPNAPLDATITASVPFPETINDQFPDPSSPQTITFFLRRASMTLWDTILRWAGGEEKMKESRKILDRLKPHKRAYLAYQLPEGALLSQLQTAAKPLASLMRPLKPPAAPPAKPKRKAVPRKSPGEGGGISRKASTSNIATPSSTNSPAPPKRQRLTSTKPTAPANQIRCMTCGQTDVPLILGGRYCRPCVESGKSNLVASGTVPSTYRYYFATDTSKLNILTAPPSTTPTQPSSQAITS